MILTKLKKIKKEFDDTPLNISAEFFICIIEAEALASVGHLTDAIDILAKMGTRLKQSGFVYLEFLSNAVLAFILAANGDYKKAVKTAENSLFFASKYMFMQVYVDASYICMDFWDIYRANGGNEDYKKIISKVEETIKPDMNKTDASIKSGGDKNEFNLSERELEILALLGQGLTNKHVARALSIGDETVKWHIKNIFGKLEVNSRVNAVQKGRRFSLIE